MYLKMMRSFPLGVLAAALVCATGEGASFQASTLPAEKPGDLGTNEGYPSFAEYAPKHATGLPREGMQWYEDNTLTYLQGEPTTFTVEQTKATPHEASLTPTGGQPVEDVREIPQNIDPSIAMRHIGGIKTLLVSCLVFFFFLLLGFGIVDDSVYSGARTRRNISRKMEDMFVPFGMGTALLVSGLVELFSSLLKIRRGNVLGEPEPRIRGLIPFLVLGFICNVFSQPFMKTPPIRDYFLGLGGGFLGLFVSTLIQVVDHKLKKAAASDNTSTALASIGATPSSGVEAMPQPQTG